MNTPTPPLPSAVVAIREALAAGPTPGPWVAPGLGLSVHATTDNLYGYGPALLAGDSKSGTFDNWKANVAYVAACNPVAITALLERIAALEADARRYQWLRDEHEARDSGETFCVFEPDLGLHCLSPVGSMPGELDAAIDAALANERAGGGEKL